MALLTVLALASIAGRLTALAPVLAPLLAVAATPVSLGVNSMLRRRSGDVSAADRLAVAAVAGSRWPKPVAGSR